ncbi:septum formation initiator family protein [bacterium]|nr:septum formation initiator family protein [bacterium]
MDKDGSKLIGKLKLSDKKRLKKSEKIYYSGLTIFLLLALIQVGWSVIMNFSKVVSFNSKISTLNKMKQSSTDYNEQLKGEIQAYSQVSQLEGIARNSLKMASEDEVLILINDIYSDAAENGNKDKDKEKDKNKNVSN